MSRNSIQYGEETQKDIFKSTAAKQAVIFILALLTSNARMLGSFSPFGVAFTAALPWDYSYISFSGSVIGYILFGSFNQNLHYITSLCIMLIVKFILRTNLKLKNNPAVTAGITTVVMIAAAFITVPGRGNNFIFIQIALECALGGAITFFCATAGKTVRERRFPGGLNLIETSSSIIVGCILLIAISNISYLYFNAGRIVAALIILTFMYKKGLTGGAVSSIIVGISLSLYNAGFAMSAGLLIAAGFLAGVFLPLGKISQVAVFICVNSFGVLVVGQTPVLFTGVIDVFVATTIFMFIPARVLDYVTAVSPTQIKTRSAQPQHSLSSRLEFTSKTLTELQGSVESVSKKLDAISGNDIFTVYVKTAEKVCRHCGMNTFCWVTAYNDTMQAFNKMTSVLRAESKVTKENSPQHFAQKCCKLDPLLIDINHNYRDFLACENAARRVSETRSVALEQFEAVINMLMEMSKELDEISVFDDSAASKAREILQNYGLVSGEICCLIDKYGRMGIEVYTDGALNVDLKLITTDLSARLERQFDLPSVITADGKSKISFFEQANYTIEFYSHQIPEGDNKVCGDSCEYFIDSKGFAHLILSDGMGSGGRAAVDSVMVCSLILKLIKAGFGFDAALKFINSSFLIKSRDESLATIDVGCIDLYTGSLEMLKAGASSSYVLKGKSVIAIDSGSLPIGILQGIDFEKKSMKLTSGDLVVMVSDGVTASGEDWIAGEIENNSTKTVKDIAERISKEAIRRRLDGHSDDITVMAARLKKV